MWWKNIFSNKSKKTEPGVAVTSDPGKLQVIIKTDLGNIRQNNEDAAIFFRIANQEITSRKGSLMIVADGMGGHQAGEVASRMATEIITREYFGLSPAIEVANAIERSFEIANTNIFRLASSNKSYKGMGTTCTAIIIVENEIYYSQVGDSRAYILKDRLFRRITTDHTYVQELINNGEITEAQAATHPKRNILTNAMGTKSSLRVDAGRYQYDFENGDRILICSDGLYDYFTDQEMGDILVMNTPPDAAEIFVNEAKRRGGHDNITVLIAATKDESKTSSARDTRDINLPITQEYNLP